MSIGYPAMPCHALPCPAMRHTLVGFEDRTTAPSEKDAKTKFPQGDTSKWQQDLGAPAVERHTNRINVRRI